MFISIEKTVECILIALMLTGLLGASSYKALGVLQSFRYDQKKLI